MIGVGKFFRTRLGYGFLTAEGVDQDILVHYSEIQEDGFKLLRKGEAVEFELLEVEKDGETKLQAKNVRRVEDTG
jgi:CspA family cold shock protein